MKFSLKSGLLALLVMVFGLTSCNTNSDPGDYQTEQYMQNCYALVTDMTTNEVIYCSGVTFYIYLNWTQASANVSFAGLKIGSNTVPVVKVENLKWSLNETDKWSNINAAAPTTTGSNKVTDLKMRWFDRLDFGPAINQTTLYAPAFEFSLMLDGRYKVIGAIQPFIMTGKTVSTTEGASPYETRKSVYTVTLDMAKKEASIGVANANFSADMPSLNMVFPGCPFTIAPDGVITIDCQSLIPTINNVPQAEFPISDLRAEINPGTGMQLDFKCNVRKTTLYDVSATLDYTSYKDMK